MSQTTIVINGDNSRCADGGISSDANTNMVTKMNELISSAKQMETFNSQDSKANILTYPCDFDHMYASMKDGLSLPNENSECKHLKEFCLLHLDLIQQQSEIIAKQEKQLQSLRQENETLKLRLQRMDRRVMLNKSKDTDGPAQSSLSINISTSPAVSPLSEAALSPAKSPDLHRSHDGLQLGELISIQSTSPRLSILTSNNERNKRVTRLSPTHWETLQPQHIKEDCAGSISSTGELRDDASSSASQKSYAAQTNAHHEDPRASISQKSRIKLDASLQPQENALDTSVTQPIASVIERLTKRVRTKPTMTVLTTDKPYYTPMGDSNIVWEPEDPESDKEMNGEILEIPQWRLKSYTSVYSMEGTEDLGDEVFLKRHQRLEIDERRRKRWDVQRIREQRHVEKLRQRELSIGGGVSGAAGGPGADKNEEPIASLWPTVSDALYLEITDDLPVSAFGHPVAKFVPSTFTLPWLHGSPLRKARTSANPRVRRRTTSGGRRKRPRPLSRQSFGVRPSLQRASTSRSFVSGRRSEVSERK